MSNPNESSTQTVKTQPFAWVVLAIAFLYSVSAAMLWFSVPPMARGIIPTYIFQLGPENIQANFGALMSHLSIAATIAALLSTWLQNKIGIKNIMLIGTAFVVAGSITAALSGNDYTILVVSRWLAGCAVGFVAVSGTTAISLWFGPGRRGLAMAIWGIWVPVAMLIVYNLIAPQALISHELVINGQTVMTDYGDPVMVYPNIHFVWWVIAVIAVVAFILALAVYRNPAGERTGQISVQKTSLREGAQYLKNRRVIGLLLCMLFYTFVSTCFVTYNVTFFTSQLGMETAAANGIASIASAAAVISPLFGLVLDKMHPNKKYIMIVIGGVAYVVAFILGFKDWGTALFFIYIIAMVFANASLVASIRPTMPMLVGKGGFTAVTIGMAGVAFMANFGQVFTNFYGVAIDRLGWEPASWVVGLPLAAMILVTAVMVRPGKKDRLPEGSTKPAVEESSK